MYYCSNKEREYPLLLGAEMLKWSHGPVHPWTRLKGWCLDNDIPAQYWFSTPVTMSGSHNRSCSCSHPGTHHAIINTSLFICSFSVLCVVCSEILADEETHQTAHSTSEFIPPRDDSTKTRGAPRCGVLLLLLLISPQDTHDTMTLNFVSIHLWLLRDSRETLRALSVMSRSLEPGDAEAFCKFIWWNLLLLQHRIIARQHCLTPPNHQFQLKLLAPCSCKMSLLLLTDCKVHRSLSS